MDTLPPQLAAFKVIADAMESACCPHQATAQEMDGFLYCTKCGAYVPTFD